MQFFITSTGTDIGKTFVLEDLCRQLIVGGEKVSAIKPVISGFRDDDPNSDSAKILKIFNRRPSKENLDQISPYRFLAPLSPNIAANLENKNINFVELKNFCQKEISKAKQNNEYLLIEGAGGVMTPINNDKTFADLILELEVPVILVIGNYLGTISHTLTAIKAMQSYQIKISQIILNCRDFDNVDASDTVKTLQGFTDIVININSRDNFCLQNSSKKD